MDPTSEPSEQDSGGVAGYLKGAMRHDAIAGLSVAVMGAPQAMAYAIIAELPAAFGLYTAIVTCIIAAAMGSSRHLVTGPTNGLCVVIGGLVVHTYGNLNDPLEICFLLTFLSGAIQLGFGMLRLGGIVRYVSNSVVIGFTAGAGVLIALNQLKALLGISFPDGLRPTGSFAVAWETLGRLGDTNVFAMIIGLLSAILVAFLPRVHGKLPAALIGVVVASVTSYLLGWHATESVQIVRQIGEIEPGIDIFHKPAYVVTTDFYVPGDLMLGALAMAILGLIEATSISRTIARSSEQRLDFNREFIGQGASKMVGSFFTCFASSGSFTRTALNFKSGGRTRMAAVFSAIWTLLILLLFGPIANYIPTSALAGLLIVTAYSMIDRSRLKLSWRSGRNSQIVLLGTIASTLVLPLQYAIFIGVFLSIAVILRTTGKTNLSQLIEEPGGGFEEVPFNRAAPSPVVVVNMDGDIYFAAAEDLDHELLKCITPQTRVVVLRMKRLRAVGSTAMGMLAQFHSLLRRRNIHLIVSGIEKELEDVMTQTGVRTKIGEENIFFADNHIFRATKLAVARAHRVAGDVPKEATDGRLRAKDVMSPQCIRFGNKHQLREAVWLISELHKHTKSMSYQALFLQDREGKLFGEMSPWLVLDHLEAGATDSDPDIDDERLTALLRRDFTRPIRLIARTDVHSVEQGIGFGRLLTDVVAANQDVTPVCDEEGRIKGLVRSGDLLKKLGDVLANSEADSQAAKQADSQADEPDGEADA